ncbi:MAG: (Na+)-NQR maturation NqrM [Candidatus Latescibacteria bacterium]|nr:(Na+)-NQR maturation NqrM [Candidatus Latescibacterota bacterium]
MGDYIAAFVVFGLVLVGMAIGVIVSNRAIKGSCGGLNNMSDQFGEPMCECGAKPGSCSTDAEDEITDPQKKARELVLTS